MTSTETPVARRRYPRAAEHRRALTLLGPFQRRFEYWNDQAAKTSALLASHLTSAEQRTELLRHLAQLTREVAESHAEFERAVEGYEHSRIDDVRAAFDRLHTILQRAPNTSSPSRWILGGP